MVGRPVVHFSQRGDEFPETNEPKSFTVDLLGSNRPRDRRTVLALDVVIGLP